MLEVQRRSENQGEPLSQEDIGKLRLLASQLNVSDWAGVLQPELEQPSETVSSMEEQSDGMYMYVVLSSD